eukprot:14896262-Alexandrium_andersonii.AAC.1
MCAEGWNEHPSDGGLVGGFAAFLRALLGRVRLTHGSTPITSGGPTHRLRVNSYAPKTLRCLVGLGGSSFWPVFSPAWPLQNLESAAGTN